MNARTDLPAPILGVMPRLTPLSAASMQRHELEMHRRAIALFVDVELSAYYVRDLSEEHRGLALGRWCDELQDWPLPAIRAAFAKHVRANPDRTPNYGHILALLKQAWGEKHAPVVRAVMARPVQRVDLPSEERRREIVAEMAARFPGLGIKRMDKPKAEASAAEVAAMVRDLNIEDDQT